MDRTIHLALAAAVGLLVAIPPEVAAATIHKCATRDGRVEYQGAPCERGERRLATWDAPPDPVNVLSEPETSRAARGPRRAARVRPARTVRTTHAAPAPDACAAARARRDEVERRVGLARTYELLASLSRDVFEACR